MAYDGILLQALNMPSYRYMMAHRGLAARQPGYFSSVSSLRCESQAHPQWVPLWRAGVDPQAQHRSGLMQELFPRCLEYFFL